MTSLDQNALAIEYALYAADKDGAESAIGWLSDYAAGIGGLSFGLADPVQPVPDGGETR
ncbi:hypothetical protein [Nonomuraea sp. NPDC050202]|uniref:hypothetical protein n=1 Tax=Nonomuraea sp. NPDC050202 TaxID=3155035 RepID=UPI0033CDCDEE